MFSPQAKKEISEKIQAILQETDHPELPEGEISFLLHVDGAENWSWANIRNSSNKNGFIPTILIQNVGVLNCEHLSVTAHLKHIPGTRFEPPEIEGWAVCDNDDCGETMDLQDIPENAEIFENYD